MAITSNYPGDLIIKLKSSNTIASVTFNEAAKLAVRYFSRSVRLSWHSLPILRLTF